MAFNGSGVFLRVRRWVNDAAAGVKIRADYHDSEDDNFAEGLTNCITKDGQTLVTQNIPMNSKRITGLADPINPQDAATKALVDTKMSTGGSTSSGNITVSKGSPLLVLDGTDTGGMGVQGQRNGKMRWLMRLGNDAAETGGNAGSNFDLHRYADDGAYLGQVMVFNRATGAGAFGTVTVDNLTCNYNLTSNGSITAAANINGNSVTAAAGGFSTTGGLIVSGSTGLQAVTAGAISAGAITGSSVTASGTIQSNNGHLVAFSGSQPTVSVSNWSTAYNCGMWMGDKLYFGEMNSGNVPTAAWMDVFGTLFRVIGNAQKPGGGSWGDSSDERIKNVLGDYISGLDAVAALQPVRFTYKGNDTTASPSGSVPYPNSFHHGAATSEKEFIGLIAQQAETSMPELVTTAEGFIDGAAVTDLRNLDTTPLIFALINAIKELKAKVEALEGAP